MKNIFLILVVVLIACGDGGEILTPPVENEIQQYNAEFIIYKSSFEIHEFNDGYYSYHTTNLLDDGMLVVGIAYGDFNNDGFVDIVGKDENNPSVIKIYTNNQDNTYLPSIISNDDTDLIGPRKIITSDVNNDGLLDIIYSLAPDDPNGERGLFILKNNGYENTWTKITLLNGNNDWIHSLTAADIDSDGNVDIFAGGKGFVFMGNGDFTFTQKDLPKTMTFFNDRSQTYDTKGVSHEMIDINGDGFVDILTGYHYQPEHSNTHAIHYGTGDETMFTEAYVLQSNYEGTNITLDFSVIDFDNDGDLDLFVNSNFNYGSKYVIQYYENNGFRNFYNKTNDIFENESNLVNNHYDIDWIKFIDMDNDGIDELVIEGLNTDYSTPNGGATFNGFKLNENNKFVRKLFL